jgi:hypothetical protein
MYKTIILHVVLYGYETCHLDTEGGGVLKKWMQNRQFGLKMEEESDGTNCIIGNLKKCAPN